jgi:alkaline phosphatase
MSKIKNILFSTIFIFLCCFLLTGCTAETSPKNIILMIGDGMGFEQVAAAGMYQYGEPGTLFMETLPYQGEVTTLNAYGEITDSAAAVTAMATGIKVYNGVINRQFPGDHSELETATEIFQDRCKLVGLVTTDGVTEATPAGFAAHAYSRDVRRVVAEEMLSQTRPNLILGGFGAGMLPEMVADAGYTLVRTRNELAAIDHPDNLYLIGQFAWDTLEYEYDYSSGRTTAYDQVPHLSEMTATALDLLDDDPNGFLLIIEAAGIDHSGHDNLLERNVFETLEFDKTVQVVLEWAKKNKDTLVIVTADHETGGLRVTQNNGQGQFPSATWETDGHSDVNIPIYAWGQNADTLQSEIDNTDIFHILTQGVETTECIDPSQYRNQQILTFAGIFLLLGLLVLGSILFIRNQRPRGMAKIDS